MNRTFFFTSYEGLRTNKSPARTFSVPAPPRASDLSGFGVCDPLTIRRPAPARRCEQSDSGESNRSDCLSVCSVAAVILAALQNLTSANRTRSSISSARDVPFD